MFRGIATALLAAHLQTSAVAMPLYRQMSKIELDALAMVGAALRDNKTAEVTSVKIVGNVVCGWVRARNGFNGVVGPISFAVDFYPGNSLETIFSDTRVEPVLFGENEKNKMAVAVLCSEEK